jgi:hypothetical protein
MCYIIASRVYPQVSTKMQTLKSRFKRDYNAALVVKNTFCEAPIEP